MKLPPIVSAQEWEAARQELRVKEKEVTRAHDALAAQRRRMPRMEVEKAYSFEGPDGPVKLVELFEGRRQLIVYRFFFEPGVTGWPERGCPGCSLMADQVAHLAHLNARDTAYARVSRAPQPDIERLKARMGWDVPWYTLTDGFDADFGVEQWHGTNAFLREGKRATRGRAPSTRGSPRFGRTRAPRRRTCDRSGGSGHRGHSSRGRFGPAASGAAGSVARDGGGRVAGDRRAASAPGRLE
ncbi:DUF899 family protein [Streptomyces sp. NPDC093228]|uniref:DUF899 family protein n=1 Tax=Streptomyces sp. NPDC093228 TaxID=3155070 RepID=UPI0034136115